MKSILTRLLCILITLPLFADCTTGAQYFFPNGKTITTDGLILIEMYGDQQSHISELVNSYVFLESETLDIIELFLIDSNKGEFHISQAVFCSSTPLIVGEQYTFKYKPKESKSILTFKRYLGDSKTNTSLSWKVVKEELSTTISPMVKYLSKEVNHFGCGPSMYVNFIIDTDENVLYKVVLKNNTNKTASKYLLKPNKGVLKVGHGMCSGAFRFVQNCRYTIEISTLDNSGQTSDPIYFFNFSRIENL